MIPKKEAAQIKAILKDTITAERIDNITNTKQVIKGHFPISFFITFRVLIRKPKRQMQYTPQ